MSLEINQIQNSLSSKDPIQFVSSSGLNLSTENSISIDNSIAFNNPSKSTGINLYDSDTNTFLYNPHDRLQFNNKKWSTIALSSDVSVFKTSIDSLIKKQLQDIKDQLQIIKNTSRIKKGTVYMWSGSIIPDGFIFCDGSSKNGYSTSDMRNRFILGSSSAQGTGGSAQHQLTINEMPEHKHVCPWGEWKREGAPWGFYGTDNRNGTGKGTDWDNWWRYSSPEGNDEPHNNLPPFYALAFIMYVG